MFDRKLLISISIVLLLTFYDFKRTLSQTNSKSTSNNFSGNDYSKSDHEYTSSVPPPKMKLHITPTIKFRYCHGSGYRNIFDQFTELVRKNYPHMAVVGENYPSPPIKALFARILSMVKIALLVCLLFGQNPFPFLTIRTPTIYSWALQNKMYACLMIFFFSNSIESYLNSTGAFEIAVNDVPLWSKLETGRLPSANEFIQMLQTFVTNIDPSNHASPSI